MSNVVSTRRRERTGWAHIVAHPMNAHMSLNRLRSLRQRFQKVHQRPDPPVIISATKGVFAPLIGFGQVGNRPALRRSALENFSEERLRRCGLLRDGKWGGELVFPSHYLLFPFLVAGTVTYLQARRPDAGSEYRWFCPSGLLPPAFNLDVLDEGHATILICEGVTDTLSAHEMGHKAIGLIGANAHLDRTTIDRLRGQAGRQHRKDLSCSWSRTGLAQGQQSRTSLPR